MTQNFGKESFKKGFLASTQETFAAGTMVELHSLSAASLNGRRGKCGVFDKAEGRYPVTLLKTKKHKRKKVLVRPDNVRRAPDADVIRAKKQPEKYVAWIFFAGVRRYKIANTFLLLHLVANGVCVCVRARACLNCECLRASCRNPLQFQEVQEAMKATAKLQEDKSMSCLSACFSRCFHFLFISVSYFHCFCLSPVFFKHTHTHTHMCM